MSAETSNPAENEEFENNLTPNTDERAVSEKQLSKWKGEGGALPVDLDPDRTEDESEQ